MSNSTISLISTIRQQFKSSKQIVLAMKSGKSKKTGGGSYVDMEEEESTLVVVKVQKPKQVANVVGIKQLMTAQVLIETNPFSSTGNVSWNFSESAVLLLALTEDSNKSAVF